MKKGFSDKRKNCLNCKKLSVSVFMNLKLERRISKKGTFYYCLTYKGQILTFDKEIIAKLMFMLDREILEELFEEGDVLL